MTYVWAVILGSIVVLIISSMVSSRLRDRRVRLLSRRLLPDVQDHIKADRHYNIALTSGTMLRNVRFLGVSHSQDKFAEYLPFPLKNWLVLEKQDGKRLFVRPNTVKYYEEL